MISAMLRLISSNLENLGSGSCPGDEQAVVVAEAGRFSSLVLSLFPLAQKSQDGAGCTVKPNAFAC